MDDAISKGLQMVGASSFILEVASSILRKDISFYKQKNKQILNQIIKNNQDVFYGIDKMKTLLFESDETYKRFQDAYKKETGKNIKFTKDDFDDKFNLVQENFLLFVENFILSTDEELVHTYLVLNKLKHKELSWKELMTKK